MIDNEVFQPEEFSHPVTNPDSATRQIFLDFDISTTANPQVFDFISAKYPNLTKLTILDYNNESFDGMARVNEFKHLTSLTLTVDVLNIAPPIQIPTLKKMIFWLGRKKLFNFIWNDITMMNVKNFLLQNC